MIGQPTPLSLTASAAYVAVAVICLAAMQTARGHRQNRWYLVIWLCVGVVFLTLAASRIFGLEDNAEALLRTWMFADGGYNERGTVQGPVAAFVIALCLGGALAFAYFVRRLVKGRREVALAVAAGASLSMMALVLIRLVSLHAIDRFLYGPLKLNWLADIGLTALVAGAAAYFILVVSGRARHL